MKLKEIKDLELIRQFIVEDSELWDRVSEDGNKKEDFKLFENPLFWWVGCYAKGIGLVGLFWFHHVNNTTIQIHAHVKKEHRDTYSYVCGVGILNYFYNELSQYSKLIAEIPTIYTDVYKYTKKFGFADEGINRMSYEKNGNIVDQYRLGTTRKEVKAWLQRQQY